MIRNRLILLAGAALLSTGAGAQVADKDATKPGEVVSSDAGTRDLNRQAAVAAEAQNAANAASSAEFTQSVNAYEAARATVSAVASILKNPAYAGAFVYGRTRMRAAREDRMPAKMPRPLDERRIVVKDKYPAYIDWDTFERIQAMLADNHANYMRVRGCGIPRNGAALLHGIT